MHRGITTYLFSKMELRTLCLLVMTSPSTKKIFFFWIATAVLLAMTGCADTDPKYCVCTEEYRTFRVRIQDNKQVGIDSMTARSINQRTGKIFTYTDSWKNNPTMQAGDYILLADNAIQNVSMAGDTIIFEAQNTNHMAHQKFFFGTDDCKCHIEKLSGPDSVTAVVTRGN